MTIWKFPLAVTDEQIVSMPEGARILCVQVQGGIPCLWAAADPARPPAPRVIRTYGTGQPLGDDRLSHYVGTYQVQGGSLVFHVFEREGGS